MPPLDQIRQSIEARLAELNDEISALQTARAALNTPGAGTAATVASTQRTRARLRRAADYVWFTWRLPISAPGR